MGEGAGKNTGDRVWIRRPVEDVYTYLTLIDDWPKWRSDVVQGKLLTEGPMRVGSRAQGVAAVMGRTITVDIEITVLEPAAKFGYSTTSGPAQGSSHLYTFESKDGGTLVVLTDKVQIGGFARILRPLMMTGLARANRKNFEGLKAVLEAQPA